MPPFLRDFRGIGRACPRAFATGTAAKAENHANNKNGERGQQNAEPHLPKGKAEAGDINTEQGPDTGEERFAESSGGIKHTGTGWGIAILFCILSLYRERRPVLYGLSE